MVEEQEGESPATPPPEDWRCKRTDGKSWRCKRRRVDGGRGFCEVHHLQKLASNRRGSLVRASVRRQGREGSKTSQTPKENPPVRKWEEKLFAHFDALQSLYEKNIIEGRSDLTSIRKNNLDVEGNENGGNEDAVRAPSSSPSSPDNGESSHQVSLLTQTQPDSCYQPPAPSASTSCMARKEQEGSRNNIGDAVMENMEIGRGKSIQRAKQVSRSVDKFSISRCAEVLNEMTGFTLEELVKASKVFVDSFNREMFLSLKDELRRAWLRAQISDS